MWLNYDVTSVSGVQVDGSSCHASGEHLYLPKSLFVAGDLESRRVGGSLDSQALVLVSVVVNGLQRGVVLPTPMSWRPASCRWDILLPDGGLRRSLAGLQLTWSAKEVPRPEDIAFDSGTCRAFYRPSAGHGSNAAESSNSSPQQQQDKTLAFGCILELSGNGVSSALPMWGGRISLRPWPEVMESVMMPGAQGELIFGVVIVGAGGSAEAVQLQPEDRQTAKYMRDDLGGRLIGQQRSKSKALKATCRGRPISWAIGEAVEGSSVQLRLLVLCVHSLRADGDTQEEGEM